MNPYLKRSLYYQSTNNFLQSQEDRNLKHNNIRLKGLKSIKTLNQQPGTFEQRYKIRSQSQNKKFFSTINNSRKLKKINFKQKLGVQINWNQKKHKQQPRSVSNIQRRKIAIPSIHNGNMKMFPKNLKGIKPQPRLKKQYSQFTHTNSNNKSLAQEIFEKEKIKTHPHRKNSSVTLRSQVPIKSRKLLSQGSLSFSKSKLSQKFPTQSFTEKRPKPKELQFPGYSKSKVSYKENGIVKAYGANTYQGLVRNYNEDRVSIILNILQPKHYKGKEPWPLCSFFAVYDGHGGTSCPDFLRDNLHQYVIKNSHFPKNPKEALRLGFSEAEKAFLKYAEKNPNQIIKSGSCAAAVLIVNNMCYVANVGDSRVVMSGCNGKRVFPLSTDHKPTQEQEQQRIIAAGGRIYQNSVNTPNSNQPIYGPYRVFPGRLSVSRTFGDIEAKLIKFGGNPNCVIAEPDLKAFQIKDEFDFIVIGCLSFFSILIYLGDGIYDKMSSQESIQVANNAIQSNYFKTIHEKAGVCVDAIMKRSLQKKTLDNITIVLIAFQNFGNPDIQQQQQEQKSRQRQQAQSVTTRQRYQSLNSNRQITQQIATSREFTMRQSQQLYTNQLTRSTQRVPQ